MIQNGVAVIDKDPAILSGLRLILDHLDGSEFINSAWQVY